MIIKVLQLNINGDNYWDKLIPFLSSHDFDVMHLQEVTGKNTHSGTLHSNRDVFLELQKILQEKYNAELTISQRYTSSPSSYMGNAIFFKKSFPLINKKELVISKHEGLFPSDSYTYEGLGRAILHLTLEIENKHISFINAHLAWAKTPQEKPHQTEQGEKVLEYLQTVHRPFIFSGDFNLDPMQPTIQKFNKIARNLTQEYHVTNTLNPRTHRAKVLFPKGVAVDYIYASNDLQIKKFAVVQEDISDHLGLTAEIEV
jgi:endonuclease/exonuclease/phosphatase family metal-dependent hydrolase